MEFILNNQCGRIRHMNAVNNGPIRMKYQDQKRSNFESYKALHIPYARTHDASIEYLYGGEHVVDITGIFPDFNKNAYDSDSYDFTLTDEYLKTITDAGTQVFYRLGNKIEHWSKKYGTLPPKDFKKWAVICEHIISHYNDGWANGYHMNIQYWEIWNEANLDPDGAEHKHCWGGTWAEFLEFYKIVCLHLKECFPELKIGGPAMADGNNPEIVSNFLEFARENLLPLDFFSWHMYACKPEEIAEIVCQNRKLLDKFGYTETESILNEWNYVKGWGDEWVYSIEQMIGMKGAAFSAATMCLCQNKPLDMLMYYDARPCTMNGLFDFYTLRPRKTYYVFDMFAKLCRIGTQIEVKDNDGIYVLGAYDGKKFAAMLVYYTDDDECDVEKKLSIKIDGIQNVNYSELNEASDAKERIMINANNCEFEIIIKPNSVVMLEN